MNFFTSYLFGNNAQPEMKPLPPTGTIIIDTTKDSFYGNDLISYRIYKKFCSDYEKYKTTDDLTIEITTMGGDIFYVLLIANILYHHKGKLTAKINEYCMSGGVVIALMCDKILLRNSACLGYIDLQWGHFGIPVGTWSKNIKEYIDDSKTENSAIKLLNTYFKMGSDMATNKNKSYEDNLIKMLSKNKTQEEVNKIVDVFYKNAGDHSMPIFKDNIPNCVNVEYYSDVEKPKPKSPKHPNSRDLNLLFKELPKQQNTCLNVVDDLTITDDEKST